MQTQTPSGILVEAHNGRGSHGPTTLDHANYQAQAEAQADTLEFMQERLLDLETALLMARDGDGWTQIVGDNEHEFSREGLRKICSLARLNWLKNPLIRRAVEVQCHYVFGQDLTIRAADDEVNDVIQAFLDDSRNRAEFTSHQSRQMKEADLRLFGNVFFVYFVSSTGHVCVRTLPVDQVDDIVCDPEDDKAPWFYLRAWWQMDLDGQRRARKVAYPDWRYHEPSQPDTVRGYEVDWGHPVYHVKSGCLSDMRFGVSEVYPALDWAKAYKAFLEDWATLTRAYSRFAHKLSLPTAKGVSAAKAQLGTTLGSNRGETNPPPTTGSTAILGPGADISPIRIGGANVAMDDGRRLLLMVAAATGLPETFFGDSAIGSLATAKSLDRPTELQMRDRQTFWGDVHQDIFSYVIEQAVRAGTLDGSIIDEEDGTPRVELALDPETGEPRDATISVEWPPVLEHDVEARVGAIADAATLKGMPLAGTVDAQTVSRLLLQALGADDIDAVMDVIYPPKDPDAPADGTPALAEKTFVEALRELRETLRGMAGQHKETG